MFFGSKGRKVIELWNLNRATTLTTKRMTISKAKKIPAILVEIEMPRIIMKTAKARKTSVQMIHGTFSSPDTL